MMDSIAILDFGSQYSQLIARRIRECQVFCEIFPWYTSSHHVMANKPKGFILSGGPASVYQEHAPKIPAYILQSNLPILGICYGMQALTYAFGGEVEYSEEREYGSAIIHTIAENIILPNGEHLVWMSHGDRVTSLPNGFVSIAQTTNSPIAAMGDLQRNYYGLQFHPEVQHTPIGKKIINRFVHDICGADYDWKPSSIILQTKERIREQVSTHPVISAVSGGVDSTVATSLVHHALGDQLTAIFVDTGLLREGEVAKVECALKKNLGVKLITIQAAEQFMDALIGVEHPEEKRRIIGELFIRIFESQAKKLGDITYLVQGTIYPDVIESSAPDRSEAARIKTHHNVGGLPTTMDFELVEPLRHLFKDEVRLVGENLGLPAEIIWRQPFPGPGLAVRCLGEVTPKRLSKLRKADSILIDELQKAGFLGRSSNNHNQVGVAQAFAILLPINSVGVMGDQRTYHEVVAIRAVTSEDFMTADWARLPQDLLACISNRIVNEVNGINRVVYDITSKPPATIEWE